MTCECQRIRDVLDPYLGGELLVETHLEVRRHLSTCELCSVEADRRRRVRTLLIDSLREDVDIEPLRRRIDQAIGVDR